MNASPTLTHDSLAIELAELVEELTARIKAGEVLDLGTILHDYPDHAEELQRLLPAMRLLVNYSDSGQALTAGLETRAEPLGDFQLIREIGRGGMGVVYEALQLSLNRRVVLKVLPFAATMDPKHLQRFRNEAQAAAFLHHTHIVPVYSVGSERGVHFYAMQFIEGRTLADLIRDLRSQAGLDASATATTADYVTNAPPTDPTTMVAVRGSAATEKSVLTKTHFNTVVEWGIQAAEALDYAHEQGIVHRDIKPANLLIDTAGQLWVADFGLAHVQSGATLTASGDLLGTLKYMSPEQALAQRAVVDHRTDIYSLGATLYELLSLRPVIEGLDRAEILRKLTLDEPKPLRKLCRSIPQELETIVGKCLEKNPVQRYATAKDLADDLRRWTANKPIKAKPPGLPGYLAKWARRHINLLASTIAVLLVATIALAVSSTMVWKKEQQTAKAQKRAEGNLRNALAALDRVYLEVAEKRYPVQMQVEAADREVLQDVLGFYEQFARENEEDPAVRYELAKAYRRVGELRKKLAHPDWRASIDRSIVLLQELTANDPSNAQYRHDLANCHVHLMQFEKAAEYWDKLAEEYPNQFEYRRGQVYVRSRYITRIMASDAFARTALPLAMRLAQDFPNEPSARFLLGESFNRSARLGRSPGKKNYNEVEEDHLAAQTILEKLVVEFPNNYDYADVLGRNYREIAILPNQSRNVEKLIRRAIELQEPIMARFPGAPEYRIDMCKSWQQLAEWLHKKNRNEEAKVAVRKSFESIEPVRTLELIDKDPRLLTQNPLNMASLLCALGQPAEARSILDWSLNRAWIAYSSEPITLNAFMVFYYEKIGHSWWSENNNQEAEAAYRKANAQVDIVVNEPVTNPPWDLSTPAEFNTITSIPVIRLVLRYELAGVLDRLGKSEEAERVYQNAKILSKELLAHYAKNSLALSRFSAFFNRLAHTRTNKYDFNKSIHLMEQSISFEEQVARSSTSPSTNLAQRYVSFAIMLNRVPAASGGSTARTFEYSEKALAVQPESQAALNAMARALLTCEDQTKRDHVRALELSQKAMAKEPRRSNVLNTHGIAHYRSGNWNEAIQAFEQSIEQHKIDTDCFDIRNWLFLAMAHWQLGNHTDAKNYYSQAVAWAEKNTPDEEMKRFRIEAEALLGINEKPQENPMPKPKP